jgi:hypothetical protein
VHPGYRGKGIFQKMLAFIDKENKTVGVDLLMGFPVEASFRNFMKDKWQNILNLQWYIRPSNPFGFFKKNIESKTITKGCIYPDGNESSPGLFRLSNDNNFVQWRRNYMASSEHYSFCYEKNGGKVIFHLKKNVRAGFLNELVIGNILFDNDSSVLLLPQAFKKLRKQAFNTFSVHFISIAINEHCSNGIKQSLQKLGFRRTEKSVYFIVKPFISEAEVIDPGKWDIYRSDIDTW